MGTADGRSRGERLLTVVLAVALVASLAGVVYVSVTPGQTDDSYTQFYLLGENGSAIDYPTSLEVGETGHVTVGLVNDENQDVTYTVLLALGDEEIDRLTVTVADGESWEERAAITPTSVGRHRFQVELYRGESVDPDADPYRQTGLWIEATS